MSTEREELAEAIKAMENGLNHTDTEWKILEKRVFAAARKHLETLPAPPDHVVVCRDNTGEVSLFDNAGVNVFTAEKAASIVRSWTLNWPSSIYTAVKVAP